MAIDGKRALVLAKNYTDETIQGGGAIAGKNCTIEDIIHNDSLGATQVIFKWTLDDGTELTRSMYVPDGVPADLTNFKAGDNIEITDNGDGTYTISATGDISVDYEQATNKPKINGVELSGDKSTSDLQIDIKEKLVDLTDVNITAIAQDDFLMWDENAKAFVNKNMPTIPSKTSDLINDSNFQTVDDVKDFAKTDDVVAKDQGEPNKGKALIVGDDGKVTVGDAGVKVSKESGNQITEKTDGIYVAETDLSEYAKSDDVVAKETGKSLVLDTDIAQITTNKTSIETLNGTGEGSVAKQIADALSAQTYLTKQIATKTEVDGYIADPTTAKFNVIYLLKDDSAKGVDKFFEYQRLGDNTSSTFECTGDTSTDLTDYAKTQDVTNELAKKQDTLTEGDNIKIEKKEDGKTYISVDGVSFEITRISYDDYKSQQAAGTLPKGYYDTYDEIGEDHLTDDFVTYKQGVENKDKILKVNSAGKLELSDIPKRTIKKELITSIALTNDAQMYKVVDGNVWDSYDEIHWLFTSYPTGGGSDYIMINGKATVDKVDMQYFPHTNMYVPFGGAYENCYGAIFPITYEEDDDQTSFSSRYWGTQPSGFSTITVYIYGVTY